MRKVLYLVVCLQISPSNFHIVELSETFNTLHLFMCYYVEFCQQLIFQLTLFSVIALLVRGISEHASAAVHRTHGSLIVRIAVLVVVVEHTHQLAAVLLLDTTTTVVRMTVVRTIVARMTITKTTVTTLSLLLHHLSSHKSSSSQPQRKNSATPEDP